MSGADKWRASAAEFLIPPQTAEELRDRVVGPAIHADDAPYWDLRESQWDRCWLFEWQHSYEPLTSIVALSTGFDGGAP